MPKGNISNIFDDLLSGYQRDDYTHRMMMNRLLDLPYKQASEGRAKEKHEWAREDRGVPEADKIMERWKTNVGAGFNEILSTGESESLDNLMGELSERISLYDDKISKGQAIDVPSYMVHHYKNMLEMGNVAKKNATNQWEVDAVLDDLEEQYLDNIVTDNWKKTKDGQDIIPFLKKQQDKIQGYNNEDLNNRVKSMISNLEDKKKLDRLFDYFDADGKIKGLQFYSDTESGRALNDKGQSHALTAYALSKAGDIKKALEHMDKLEFITSAGKGAALQELLSKGQESYDKVEDAVFKSGTTVYKDILGSAKGKYGTSSNSDAHPIRGEMNSEVAELMRRFATLSQPPVENQSIEGLSQPKMEVMDIFLKLLEKSDVDLPDFTYGDAYSMDNAVKTMLNDYGLWVYREEEATDGNIYMVDSPREGFSGTHRDEKQNSQFSMLMAEQFGNIDFNTEFFSLGFGAGNSEHKHEEHEFARELASAFVALESTIHEAEALPKYRDAIVRGGYDPSSPMTFFSTAQFDEVLNKHNVKTAIDNAGGDSTVVKPPVSNSSAEVDYIEKRHRGNDTRFRDYVRRNIKMPKEEMDKFRKSHIGGQRNPDYLKLPEKYQEELLGTKWEKYHSLL